MRFRSKPEMGPMQHSRDPHLTALESKAERDDCEAQLELARRLDSMGEGVRGAYWLQRGAACGSVSARAMLGAWLLLGPLPGVIGAWLTFR